MKINKTYTRQEREAYLHGYNDRVYGFTYLNPHYTKPELKAWSKGWKDAAYKGE